MKFKLLIFTLFCSSCLLGQTSREVDLTWDDPNPPENQVIEYIIYRGDNTGGPYVEVGRSTDVTFTDTIDPGIYWYVVTAVSTGGESVFSNEMGLPPLPVILIKIIIKVIVQ